MSANIDQALMEKQDPPTTSTPDQYLSTLEVERPSQRHTEVSHSVGPDAGQEINREALRETLVVMRDAHRRESGLGPDLDSYPGQVPSRDYYPYLFSQPNLAVERFWDNVPKYRDPELEFVGSEEKPSN